MGFYREYYSYSSKKASDFKNAYLKILVEKIRFTSLYHLMTMKNQI